MKIKAGSLMFFAVAIPMVLCLSACGKVRYPANYVLNFPQATLQGKALKLRSGTVLVREFRCPQYLCGGAIVFRPNPEEVAYYQYHRWAVNPRTAITNLTIETLQAQAIFDRVAPYETGIEAGYLLKGRIERLEEVDNARDVAVECVISAELTDAHTGALVWSGRASEKLPVVERSIRGIVNGLSQSSQTAVRNLIESMMKDIMPIP